ncbi:MAG: aspartate ammonia-lyase [Clostridiales bacterium]|nr:aspartate ammonia-lyase [Clostridiales bacterium]
MQEIRLEKDSIGVREIPKDVYYGVQSLRAFENFPISGKKVHTQFIRAIAEIKKAAALTNMQAGVIQENIANAMITACDEIIAGKFASDFIVDTVQGGAGTSLNMNANEVIANRAIELLGKQKGDYSIVHPNDHANCAQSTNDVFPSAGKLAAIRLLQAASVELSALQQAFLDKSQQYSTALKMGRTEMQDAVPISFGQVFQAYASALSRDITRFSEAINALSVLNMGGTAIGTGISASEYYMKNIIPNLCTVTNLKLMQADDLIDSTQNLDVFVYVSGIVKSCAVTLSKIANDLRLMSSGPRTGFAEINLPAKQNGSSIMPGKINPVIPEVVSQVAFLIIGNDTTITHAAEAGQLELNAFEPIIFSRLFESLDTLANVVRVFKKDCVDGITVNVERSNREIEESITTITAFCPLIGYSKAASLAKKALRDGKTIRQILLEENVLSSEEIDKILSPDSMI